MKNKLIGDDFSGKIPCVNLFYRTMRITVFLLCICSFCAMADNAHSQTAKVTLKKNQGTMLDVLHEIEHQTNYLFIYSNDVDMSHPVSIDVKDKTVETVLTRLFAGKGISFQLEGMHIVLSANPATVIGTGTSPQQRETTETLTGTVFDEQGEPLIGVSVKVQGTNIGAITDMEGKFTLQAPLKSTLEISFIGYKPRTITVGKEKHFNIYMEEDTKLLDEVIVVGYGTTSKRKTSAAIASINAADIAKTPTANITQSLAGRAPGLIVNTSGGGINNYASISIRGGETPLFVIDDIICEERDFRNLNPEDIDQMSILKDAASTAVYGARAANGIIMVVTKQGKAGKMSVNYSFNYNWSRPTIMPEKLSSYEAARYLNMGLANDGMKERFSAEELKLFADGSDQHHYPNVDWQELAMNRFAPEQRHTLTVTGGSEKVKAYTSFSYYDQQSIYKNNTNNLQRYNYRTNLVADFKEVGLKVTSDIEGYLVKSREPLSTTGGNYYSVWSHIQNKLPWENAYNQYGQLNNIPDNPMAEISPEAGYSKGEIVTVRANLGLEWSVPWMPGLRLKTMGNYRITSDRQKDWKKSPILYDWDGNPNTPSKPSLNKYYWNRQEYTVQAFANYDRTFNALHTVDFTAGIEANKYMYDNATLGRKEYLLDVDQINPGPVATATNSSTEGTHTRAGVVARLKYDYASKYVVDGSMRYDGSDNFPRGKRWGTFYAASAAWVLSEEAFWQNLKDRHIFDLFKIRASYGEIGQDNIAAYAYLQSYGLDERGYLLGGSFYPGFSEGTLVSKDITWYTTRSMNIGVDFSSLNNRLSGSVEYFRMSTKGYLTSPSNVNYTDPLGTALPQVKSDGESIRQGGEFILQWKEKRGDFEYAVAANFTYFDSYWMNNPYESVTDLKNPYKRTTHAKGYWGVGYETLGYYQNQEDVMNSPKRQNSVNLGAGDIKYHDFNGDGIIDGNDQHRIGKNASPRGQYGLSLDLNYKGWFLNMLWQGATAKDFYLGDKLQGQGTNAGYLAVIYDFQKDVWTPENTDAKFPRLRSTPGYNGNNNYASSDFWLLNTGYLRLKNLNIGYDLKHKVLKRVPWITKCDVSLSGYNLLTFSSSNKYNIDPEIGDGNLYTYPVSKVYSISFNIGF
ncbi:TonB-dependent receptor [Bacteroides heparinolyticus]|uniref:TonB-dependent receptor n=1 Tax=Prevotella heparinolytica TaxID=28113 RepID=UPI0023F43A70|nr:TonB-dependent receptor [Bacteroides heparinolyticus]